MIFGLSKIAVYEDIDNTVENDIKFRHIDIHDVSCHMAYVIKCHEMTFYDICHMNYVNKGINKIGLLLCHSHIEWRLR